MDTSSIKKLLQQATSNASVMKEVQKALGTGTGAVDDSLLTLATGGASELTKDQMDSLVRQINDASTSNPVLEKLITRYGGK